MASLNTPYGTLSFPNLFQPKPRGDGGEPVYGAVLIFSPAQQANEAYKKISEVWIRDAPAHVIAIVPQAIVHTTKMHDIVRTGSSITLYDKAWIEK